MDLKNEEKKDTKHETFKERWKIQFRKAFTNRPDSERLSREWTRHSDGWNVPRAMLNADNEWEEKVDLICRVKKTQQSKNISHQETWQLQICARILYLSELWWGLFCFFQFTSFMVRCKPTERRLWPRQSAKQCLIRHWIKNCFQAHSFHSSDTSAYIKLTSIFPVCKKT